MKVLLAMTILCAIPAFSACPDLTEELAKKVANIDCEHKNEITISMQRQWMMSKHHSNNVCWTVLRHAKNLSQLLMVRKLALPGTEFDEMCEYDRDDRTTYLHMDIPKDTFDE